MKAGYERRLKAAYAKLMKALNDDDQEGCLYEQTLEARDAVNKILNESQA
jgi:hypothetical protein